MEVKKRIKLKVGGMACTHCENSIKKYLTNQGVTEISASHVLGEVYFAMNPLDGRVDLLKEGIEALGYEVSIEKDKT